MASEGLRLSLPESRALGSWWPAGPKVADGEMRVSAQGTRCRPRAGSGARTPWPPSRPGTASMCVCLVPSAGKTGSVSLPTSSWGLGKRCRPVLGRPGRAKPGAQSGRFRTAQDAQGKGGRLVSVLHTRLGTRFRPAGDISMWTSSGTPPKQTEAPSCPTLAGPKRVLISDAPGARERGPRGSPGPGAGPRALGRRDGAQGGKSGRAPHAGPGRPLAGAEPSPPGGGGRSEGEALVSDLSRFYEFQPS